MKKCHKCLELKELTEFTKNVKTPDKLSYKCRPCAAVEYKNWRENLRSPEAKANKKLRDKQYARFNKDNIRNIKLKQAFGITLEDYNRMFAAQNGCCKICGHHQSEFKKALSVDHNHITGQIRRLLCGTCNPGLGLFKADESIELLEKALSYLKDSINSTIYIKS